MPAKIVILVRHAQSEHHVNGMTGGWTDTPLTRLGHQQATRLAARLGEELAGVPVALYTSDLLRAGQTARHLAAAFGVEAVADQRLREWNNGAEANITRAEGRARFPDAYGRSIWGGDEPLFPGSETGREFSARCGAFLDGLPEDGPLPVIVTHGGTILAMVGWLGMPPESLGRINFHADPTSISVLVDSQFRGVARLNDTAHLAGTESQVSVATLAQVYSGHG
jgi:probable phosphoglycerate mutase